MSILLFLGVFVLGGGLFIGLGWAVGGLFRPYQPSEEKNAIYESGEDSLGNNLPRFNSRFLFIALLFLLFEIELALLFPWAVVADYAQQAHIAAEWLIEMSVFVGLLTLGLLFVWKKGLLQWDYTSPSSTPLPSSQVPTELYQQVGKTAQGTAATQSQQDVG